jgi:hypothetical protein
MRPQVVLLGQARAFVSTLAPENTCLRFMSVPQVTRRLGSFSWCTSGFAFGKSYDYLFLRNQWSDLDKCVLNVSKRPSLSLQFHLCFTSLVNTGCRSALSRTYLVTAKSR